MTENLRRLAETLEETTPDSLLEKKVLKDASTIRAALETNGEFVFEDESGNSYRITPKNGHIQLNKSR